MAVVTVTATRPAFPCGVVTVIDMALSAVIVVAAQPKSTAVAPPRMVPMIVTIAPPVGLLEQVLSDVIDGVLQHRCTRRKCSWHSCRKAWSP